MILLTYMFSDESGPHEYSTFLFSGKLELLGLVREAREERKRQEEIFVPMIYSFFDVVALSSLHLPSNVSVPG